MNQCVYLSIESFSSNADSDDHDLILMDEELSVIDIFDPFVPHGRRKSLFVPSEQKTLNSPSSAPVETDRPPTPETPVLSSHFPYPIRLRLKQRAYPEMKQFSHFVQLILAEQRSEQVNLTEGDRTKFRLFLRV